MTLIVVSVLIALVVVILARSCNKPKENGPMPEYRTNGPIPTGLEIPAVAKGDQIINHSGHTLCFSPEHAQARWVAYPIRGSQLASAHYERTDQFMPDPQAQPRSADDKDYQGSGYDRGHLASAEDMSWSRESMEESFYYSNMSPQVPAFNRGVWRRLEELVRYWSAAYDSVYVVTGPILTSELPTIGSDNVSVPRYYYKAVLEYNPKGARAIGFLLPNEASAATLKSFAVSVDSLEHLTGLDFFPALPDDVEEKLESTADIRDWRWTRKRKKRVEEY
jgi:endonuclease G